MHAAMLPAQDLPGKEKKNNRQHHTSHSTVLSRKQYKLLFDSQVTCLQLCAAMVAEQCVCIHICMADGALFGLTARAVSRIG